MAFLFFLLLLVSNSLVACDTEASIPNTPVSTLQPTIDAYYYAQGVGDPRSPGYWQLWNSCAPDNRSETAAANGGRQAGWVIMDDLLQEPGILLGEVPVTSCADGLRILQGRPIVDITGANDPAYLLAAQLLTAQLNLAVGAEYCPAIDDAVRSSQLLLMGVNYSSSGSTLSSEASLEERDLADFLTEQLTDYNAGILCR